MKDQWNMNRRNSIYYLEIFIPLVKVHLFVIANANVLHFFLIERFYKNKSLEISEKLRTNLEQNEAEFRIFQSGHSS